MTGNTRTWLLFMGWLATGACYVLTLLTVLTIGIYILPITVAATIALATRRDTRQGMPGLLSGASLPLFLLAYLNRHGPGTYCTTSASGGDSCTEGLLNPWVLLAVGLLVLSTGPALLLTMRRRPANSPAHTPSP
ncbi:hypothetical protein [Streptomyces melanogenes]|uniref:hypothetical protein n=1 Tax=Streptomyces melanogenes TaxID=67326 RepID=UPI00167CC0F1|nr:hypothetical protein [Streptomyces melanogenes]GGP89219.1 hypothetical protein GCM10010278_79610 [Streptomyces melanogenes]